MQREFIKNNVAVLAGHVLIYIKGILFIPLVMKLAGVTVYGGYVLISGILSFLYGISSLGYGYYRSRYLPSTTDKKERSQLFYNVFNFQFIMTILVSFIFIMTYSHFNNFFIKESVKFSTILILPYIISLLLFSHSSDYFRYTHRMGYFNFATILHPYLHIILIAVIYIAYRNISIDTLIMLEIAACLLAALPLIVRLLKEIGFLFYLPDMGKILKDVKIGYLITLAYIVDVVLNISDRYIIAAYMSVRDVGCYSPAYALGSLIIFFPKVSGVVLPPLLCKAVDNGDLISAKQMLLYTIKGYLLIAIPFVAGSLVMSKPILNILANSEVADSAFLVTPIVASGMIFYGLNLIMSNLFFVELDTKSMFRISIIAAAANIIFNLILFMYFRNILIAAITTLAGYLAAFLFMVKNLNDRAVFLKSNISITTVVRRHVLKLSEYDVKNLVKVILKSMMASMVMAAVVYKLMDIMRLARLLESIQIIAGITIGVIIYCIAIIAMKCITIHEIRSIRNAIYESKA